MFTECPWALSAHETYIARILAKHRNIQMINIYSCIVCKFCLSRSKVRDKREGRTKGLYLGFCAKVKHTWKCFKLLCFEDETWNAMKKGVEILSSPDVVWSFRFGPNACVWRFSEEGGPFSCGMSESCNNWILFPNITFGSHNFTFEILAFNVHLFYEHMPRMPVFNRKSSFNSLSFS